MTGMERGSAGEPSSAVAENVARVRDRIDAAACRAGRPPGSVRLLAVTKTVDADRIRAAYAAGVRDFGENYYQEAREKLPLFGPEVRWHFIGHLQTNKARNVVGRFALIHSVDRRELAAELGRRATACGVTQPVLVEVRLDAAATKHGVDAEEALDLAFAVRETPGLDLLGLMGMPPYADDPEVVRPEFRRLRALFERLPESNRRILSMGMTADFEAAIEEGATLVRIGTAIFGRR